MRNTAKALVTVLLVLAAGLAGCNRTQNNDRDAITSLLANSGYTNDNHATGYGSSDTTLQSGGDGSRMATADYQRIPFVRFRRYIPPGGITRTVNVAIPAYPGWDDTTALATIAVDIVGELRTVFDTTTNPINVWRKPFHDVATRRVLLTKPEGGEWHIRRISPLRTETENAAYHLEITSLRAVSRLSHDTFNLTTTDTLLTKEQLPWFLPGDTVHVWVSVSSDGDSCWAFLHHGRPGTPHIWRRPYFRTATDTFERDWVVGDETYDRPEVRPSEHDVIGWGTLWADTSKPYVAAVWGIPYVVRYQHDALPSDE